MSRPSLRRTPNIESLETRQVLSSVVGPSPDQQFALELINLVRTNPSAAAAEITSTLSPDVKATLNQYGLTVSGLQAELNSATPQPPLAWSDSLGNSAQQQSQYEASNGVQTHQGPGEASLEGRMHSAGYTNDLSYGENTYAWATSIEEAMQSFLFDWGVSDHGHYQNLLQPGTSAENSYKDVGIGLVNTSGNGAGPLVITQDFGSQQDEGPQILGVVYDDPNNTGFYNEGQGQGGVTIDVKNLATGQDSQTQTWNAGGYQLPVAANAAYQVTAIENGQVISSQRVQVGDVNVETDFVNNSATNPPAPAPAPVAAPVPAPLAVTTPAPVQVATSSTQQAQPVAQPPVLIPTQQLEASTPVQGTTTQSSNSGDIVTLDISGWDNWTV